MQSTTGTKSREEYLVAGGHPETLNGRGGRRKTSAGDSGRKKIFLKAENLTVDRHREKVGEVTVRKEIETETVEVPVRREKLVVEAVDSDEEPLAEIDLSEPQVGTGDRSTVTGEFYSLEAARDLLSAIALNASHRGCDRVRLELVLNDPQDREIYQALFDRCCRPKP